MKINYKNIIIVILLLLVGALIGGWIVYANMKSNKSELNIPDETKKNELKARIDSADNAELHHIADSLLSK